MGSTEGKIPLHRGIEVLPGVRDASEGKPVGVGRRAEEVLLVGKAVVVDESASFPRTEKYVCRGPGNVIDQLVNRTSTLTVRRNEDLCPTGW